MSTVLTGTYRVKSIKKKMSAKIFKDLKVGDVFKLKYDLNGKYRGAPHVDIYIDEKHVHTNKTLQLRNNLLNFELEEII